MRRRLSGRSLLLGLDNGDGIGEGLLDTGLAVGVASAHNLDLDTEDTLSEEDVAGSRVDKVTGGLTGVDHETVLHKYATMSSKFQTHISSYPNPTDSSISPLSTKEHTYSELHGLGTGSSQLSRNNNLTTLRTRLHNKPQNTIARTTNSKTVQELVAERLALGNGTQTTVLDLGSIQGDGVFGELEALLDERGELTNAASLLSENLLGVGGTDDYEMSVSESRFSIPLSRGI